LNGTLKENGMNGWQRLWVLLTLLLGVGVVLAYLHGFPSSRGIDTSYANTISKLNEDEKWAPFPDAPPTAQQKGKLTFDDLPEENSDKPKQGAFDDLIPKKSFDQLKEEARLKYDKLRQDARVKYDFELSELSKKRWENAVAAMAAWLLISFGLYGLGWMINWVYRGFRPKKV
jgi:hypothetical protein